MFEVLVKIAANVLGDVAKDLIKTSVTKGGQALISAAKAKTAKTNSRAFDPFFHDIPADVLKKLVDEGRKK